MDYRKDLDHRYELHCFYGRYTCTYCGDNAMTVDHVPPISSLYMMIGSVPESKLPKCYKVPACTECNLILSSVGKFTVHSRAIELKSRLKKRYKKILSLPDWTEEELNQLKPTLRKHVENGIVQRSHIKIRLAYQLPGNPKVAPPKA